MKTFDKNLFKQPFFWTSIFSFLALGILVALYSHAWVAPTASPNSSAGAAINFSGGNVGIGLGTATPVAPLDIVGVGSGLGYAFLGISEGSMDPYNYIQIQVHNAGTLANPYSRILALNPNGGNVGIGTTTPGEKLEVAGNIKMTGTGNGIKFPDGTSQTTAASAGGNMSWPSSVIQTTATHNGQFATDPANGYAAMETWIQSNGCSGYHVCMSWELSYAFGHLSSTALCGTGSCSGTYTSGEGITSGYGNDAYSDCGGWTCSVGYSGGYGMYWSVNKPQWFMNVDPCSTANHFLCCK